MFTFKCLFHNPTPAGQPAAEPNYQVYQGDAYVVRSGDDAAGLPYSRIVQVLPTTLDGCNAAPDDGIHLYVGPKQPLAVIYVMNQNGKTVDVIR